MAPDFGQAAPAFGTPPGAAYPGMPPGPPPGALQQPPPQQQQQQQQQQPQHAGPPQQQPAAPVPSPGGAPWIDPAAFAATAPPPTAEEHDAQNAAAPAPAPAMPEAHRSTPPPQPAARPQSGSESFEVAPDAPRVLAGFLVSYEGDENGTFWPIYQGKNLVGRKGAADGLDIEVDHPTTSSRHATVHATARPGRLKVEDPGSTNGTFVNDQKMAKGSQQELKDGDTLRFGGYSVTVKIV